MIAMEGQTRSDGSDVDFEVTPQNKANGDGTWTQIYRATAILDPYAKTWGSFAENSSTKVSLGTTSFSLDEVRAKFGSDAVIWLYICHAAYDPMLFQQVANTFQITAKGFSKEWCAAPRQFPDQSQAHPRGRHDDQAGRLLPQWRGRLPQR